MISLGCAMHVGNAFPLGAFCSFQAQRGASDVLSDATRSGICAQLEKFV